MRKLTKTAAVVAAMSMMTMGMVATVNADEMKNTWSQENGSWYYYDNSGNKVSNQWAIDSAGDWYFLGDDCRMVTSAFINNDIKEVVDVTDDSGDDFYYVDASGKMLYGQWAEIDTSEYATPTEGASKFWYYFGASGVAYADQWIRSGNDWYYVKDNCKMAENYTHDNYYLLPSSGKMLTGWYKTTKDDGKNNIGENNNTLDKNVWVYADNSGELKQGWVKVSGKWYWLGDAEGNKAYSMLEDAFMNDGTDTFYLKKSSGEMATGYTKVADKEYYFFDSSKGTMSTDSFKTVSNKYYYFDENGLSVSDADKDNSYFYVETYANNGSKVTATGCSIYADMDAAVQAEATAAGNTYKIYKLGTTTVKTIKK